VLSDTTGLPLYATASNDGSGNWNVLASSPSPQAPLDTFYQPAPDTTNTSQHFLIFWIDSNRGFPNVRITSSKLGSYASGIPTNLVLGQSASLGQGWLGFQSTSDIESVQDMYRVPIDNGAPNSVWFDNNSECPDINISQFPLEAVQMNFTGCYGAGSSTQQFEAMIK
jgi:hypothetical protein